MNELGEDKICMCREACMVCRNRYAVEEDIPSWAWNSPISKENVESDDQAWDEQHWVDCPFKIGPSSIRNLRVDVDGPPPKWCKYTLEHVVSGHLDVRIQDGKPLQVPAESDRNFVPPHSLTLVL